MAGHRIERISEDIKRILPEVFRGLSDPRVSGAMLSVTHVALTNDLSYATVFVSAVEGIERSKTAVEGLTHASGLVRSALAKELSVKKIPELRFKADDSIEYGSDISSKLKKLNEQE